MTVCANVYADAMIFLQPACVLPVRYGDLLPVGDPRRAAGERALGHSGVGRGLVSLGPPLVRRGGHQVRSVDTDVGTVCRTRYPTKPRSAPRLRQSTGDPPPAVHGLRRLLHHEWTRTGRLGIQAALSPNTCPVELRARFITALMNAAGAETPQLSPTNHSTMCHSRVSQEALPSLSVIAS